MGWPTLKVEIDATNGPLTANASNSWLDRSDETFKFSIKRGRQDELGRVEAGTAEVEFDNVNRDYNPTGALGLFGLRPMRKLRISAVWSGTTYRLYTGYIESIAPTFTGAIDSTAVMSCADAFKYFALKKLNGAYASEYTNWSIDTWLTNISWPAADRQLFSGESQIQAGTFVNTPALTHFRNVEAVENGLFFIDGQGRPTFHDRYYRLVNSLASQATFGDDLAGTELPFLRTTVDYGDTYIWNEARITRTGGTEQVATDATSQADYFARTYAQTLPLLSDTEALGLAQWFVARYKDPAFRFTSVTVDGAMSDSLWPHILGRSIGERITIVDRSIGVRSVTDPATVVTQQCYIEGISHEVTDEHWLTTFQLSPADAGAFGLTFWVLDDSSYSVLESTTRLAY